MDQDVSVVREQANEALRRFDWGQVGELLGSVDPSELSGEELFTLGTALNATGDWDQSEVVFQMAHTRAVDDGDQAAAAWTALFLTFMAGAKGEEALMGGWIATAGRFIEGLPECKVHALVPVLLSYPAMLEGDYDTIVESNIAALELARRLGERDLEMWALQREGMARTKRGEVQAGMAMVDEAMVAALSATMAPWAMGQIFCQTLTLCQELGDIKRASQWIEASDRVTSARGIAFSGDCRIHRAGVMKQRGSLARAEAEARLGCAEYTFETPHNGWGWSEIGEIRLRVGDLEGAEEAFTLAHERGYPPDPGFALLRMAQGRPALAVDEIERALEQQVVDRSVRVKLLDAAVHIRLTVGDIAGAQAACEELTEIVAIFGSDTFKASALCSRGTLSSAHGDFETAKTSLRAGIADWLKVGAPYEAARARVQLAEIAIRADDPHAARRELQAARSTFQELGAERRATRSTAPGRDRRRDPRSLSWRARREDLHVHRHRAVDSVGRRDG